MCKRVLAIWLMVFVASVGLIRAAEAQDAAMIVDLKGDQIFYAGGDLDGQGIVLMDFLMAGDRIEIKSGTTVVLNYFASGVREEISGPMVVTIGTESSRKEGQGTIKSEKVKYLSAQTRNEPGDAQHVGSILLRGTPRKDGDEAPMVLNSPAKTAVRSAPLVFRWQPVDGADQYQLTVKIGKEEALKTIIDQPSYNFEQSGIPRGVQILWTVEALAGGRVIGRGHAIFYLITVPQLQEIANSEQAIDKEFSGDSIEGLIAKVMLYKQHELNDEARELLLKLREKYPRNVTIVRHIKDLRRNYRPNL